MKKTLINFLTFVTLLIIFLSFSGKSSFKIIKSIDISGDFITTDNLGNLFLIDDNKVFKYDETGTLIYTFSSPLDGTISFLDPSDPLKILVFYKDFGRIKFLDNKLSVKGDYIALQDLSLEQASLACSSYENSFWIYDQPSFKLYRIDQYLQISQTSGNISQITGLNINPNYMTESNNFLYLNDPSIGVLIFDRYGAYLKTIPVKDMKSFQLLNNKLVYNSADTIKTLDFKTFEESKTLIPDKLPLYTRIEQSILYVMTDKKLTIYKYSQ